MITRLLNVQMSDLDIIEFGTASVMLGKPFRGLVQGEATTHSHLTALSAREVVQTETSSQRLFLFEKKKKKSDRQNPLM